MDLLAVAGAVILSFLPLILMFVLALMLVLTSIRLGTRIVLDEIAKDRERRAKG